MTQMQRAVRPRAAIFDMDGLLLDSERCVKAVWVSMKEQWNIPDIEDIYYLCIGCNRQRTREILLEHYGEDFPYWEFREAASKIYEQTYEKDGLPVKAGARELLEAFRAAGIPMALASSTREVVVRRELEQVGLLSYFDVIATGDMVENSKPNPEIFLLAKKMLEEKRNELVEAADCMVFEDSFNGIRAASAAGMRPVMVPDLIPPDREMENLSEVILPSLEEAIVYLSL